MRFQYMTAESSEVKCKHLYEVVVGGRRRRRRYCSQLAVGRGSTLPGGRGRGRTAITDLSSKVLLQISPTNLPLTVRYMSSSPIPGVSSSMERALRVYRPPIWT
jgi:hypothetical protein